MHSVAGTLSSCLNAAVNIEIVDALSIVTVYLYKAEYTNSSVSCEKAARSYSRLTSPQPAATDFGDKDCV